MPSTAPTTPPAAADLPREAGSQDLALEPPAPGELERFAKSANAFAYDLWDGVRTKSGNLVISPVSITSALAMTAGGAKGTTATEMKRVLHLEGDTQEALTAAGKLLVSLRTTEDDKVKFRVGNRLFGDKSYAFEPSYLDRVRQTFGASLEPVDVRSAAETTRLHINTWVAERTENRIRDLLPGGSVDASTRLILVNAIAFSGAWRHPFTPSATKSEAFHASRASSRDVPMMHAVESFDFAAADHVKIVEMSYGSTDLAMMIVVPDAIDGLPAVEKSLRGATIEPWARALKQTRVDLALPRFEINPAESVGLRRSLEALGMPSAFDAARADFTGIASPLGSGDRLYLKDVFHKAFIKTDETGTEAAAATGAVMKEMMAPIDKPVVMRVDRPFLFFLRDKRSSAILFMGRVVDPR